MRQQESKKITKKQLLLIAGLIIAGIAALLWGLKTYMDAPRDLGEDIVYIGKQDYGNIFGFDQLPGSTYYFETNMSKQHLEDYVNKTAYTFYTENGGGKNADYEYTDLNFASDGNTSPEYDKNRFFINYFDEQNTKAALPILGLKHTGKKYLIAIDSEYYPRLRQALQQANLLR